MNKVKLNYQAGFTLVEIITAIFIVSFLIMAIVVFQNIILTQQQVTFESYISVETANRSIEKLVKEIRNSRHGDNGAYTLVQVSDQSLIFYSNVDQDDDIERVCYFLDGRELKKGVTDPTPYPVQYPAENEQVFTVAEHIQNTTEPIFYYYNGDWPSDTTNNPLEVSQRLVQTRTIEIHLIVNSNSNILKTNHEIRSSAQIRTLKDNL